MNMPRKLKSHFMYETKVSDSVECLIGHMFLFLLFYKAYNDYVAVLYFM